MSARWLPRSRPYAVTAGVSVLVFALAGCADSSESRQGAENAAGYIARKAIGAATDPSVQPPWTPERQAEAVRLAGEKVLASRANLPEPSAELLELTPSHGGMDATLLVRVTYTAEADVIWFGGSRPVEVVRCFRGWRSQSLQDRVTEYDGTVTTVHIDPEPDCPDP